MDRLARALGLSLMPGDGHRRVLRAEEPGPDVAVQPAGRDRDVARQVVLRVAEFLGEHRPERRVRHHLAGQLAGVQQLRGPAVLALLGGHAADDAEVLGGRGELRQVLADPQPRDGGVGLLGRPAVLVAGLEVPGVGLAGAAGHPQDDARLGRLLVRRPPPAAAATGRPRPRTRWRGSSAQNHAD